MKLRSSTRVDDRPRAGGHPVDEVLPVGQLVTYGVQHVLTMYAGVITRPRHAGADAADDPTFSRS